MTFPPEATGRPLLPAPEGGAPRMAEEALGRAPLFPDEERAREFFEGLEAKTLGRRARYIERTDSTNSVARRLWGEGWPLGTVVLAEHQGRGRGRFGKVWECPPRGGILFSALVSRPEDELDLPWLAAAGSLAAASAVAGAVGLPAQVAWPNDVVCSGLKLGGVLVETWEGAGRTAVVGIGLNVNILPEEFPDALRGKAGAISGLLGREADRRELLAHLVRELEARLDRPEEIPAEYETRCVTPGTEVAVAGPAGPERGRALYVDELMRLVVEFPDGSRRGVTRLHEGDPGPAGAAT